MRRVPFALLLLTAACTERRAAVTTADVSGAAAAAQGDIDTYAADRRAANGVNAGRMAPAASRLVASPPAPPPPPTAIARPAADPAAPDAIVRRYYAALADRRFADAYRLWDDDGRASGVEAGAFAAEAAPRVPVRAEVGQPGRVEAGAGQRWVEVPVALREGTRPPRRGTVTLHRVGDVDGASAAARSWRIAALTLAPRADATPGCDAARRVSDRAAADGAPLWRRTPDCPPGS